MSNEWVETCGKILDQIREMSKKKERDRLEIIQSMRFSLYALQRSILGWLNWVNNPDIMVSFKPDELEEMNKNLVGLIQNFIKYDIEVTEKGTEKSSDILKEKQDPNQSDRRSPNNIFYV